LVLGITLCLSSASAVSCADEYTNYLEEFNGQQANSFFSQTIKALDNPQPSTSPSEVQAPKREEEPLDQQESPPRFYRNDTQLKRALSREEGEKIVARRIKEIDLLSLVDQRNPAIKGAEQRVKAARQNISQAANLDAILQEYAAFSATLATPVGPMKGEKATERFPFPALTALKGQIAAQDVVIAQEELEITRRRVLTQTQETFWKLYYNQEAAAITSEMIGLLEHLESVARARYETGKAGFQELIQVEIPLEIVRERLTTFVESQRSLEEDIRRLADLTNKSSVGRPLITPEILSQKRTLSNTPIERLNTWALGHRQEIRRLRAQIRKQELLIELAESRILPPFTLNLSAFANTPAQINSGQGSFPTVTKAPRGAGLPVAPWFGTNDAFLERSRRVLAARKADLLDLINRTQAQIHKRWAALDEASRNVVLYQDKVVGLSQAALDVVTQGYETGKTPFAQVNVSYQNWLTARLELEKNESEVGIAASRLYEVLGTLNLESQEPARSN